MAMTPSYTRFPWILETMLLQRRGLNYCYLIINQATLKLTFYKVSLPKGSLISLVLCIDLVAHSILIWEMYDDYTVQRVRLSIV